MPSMVTNNTGKWQKALLINFCNFERNKYHRCDQHLKLHKISHFCVRDKFDYHQSLQIEFLAHCCYQFGADQLNACRRFGRQSHRRRIASTGAIGSSNRSTLITFLKAISTLSYESLEHKATPVLLFDSDVSKLMPPENH
uniref:Uncharacterized protein n=1 Tax=Romanomermis culicivorax TaxID=13658 RepID=A0A915IB84_ROMCU